MSPTAARNAARRLSVRPLALLPGLKVRRVAHSPAAAARRLGGTPDRKQSVDFPLHPPGRASQSHGWQLTNFDTTASGATVCTTP
jgi:hypothetical protein